MPASLFGAELKREAEGRIVPPRILSDSLNFNAIMNLRVGNVCGYAALTPWRVWNYMHATTGVPLPFLNRTYYEREVRAAGFDDLRGLNVMAKIDAVARWEINADHGKRAWLVRSYKIPQNWLGLVLNTRTLNFEIEALVEEAPPAGWSPGVIANASDSVVFENYRPDEIELRIDASLPALLVLAEA